MFKPLDCSASVPPRRCATTCAVTSRAARRRRKRKLEEEEDRARLRKSTGPSLTRPKERTAPTATVLLLPPLAVLVLRELGLTTTTAAANPRPGALAPPGGT